MRQGDRIVGALRKARRRWARHHSLIDPVSTRWGYDRGDPIDRHYIEAFLARHRTDVHGRILEVKSDEYARRFGQPGGQVDVLDIDPANPEATVVGDVGDPATLPAEAYDCIVFTQTLHLVWDFQVALGNLHRALRPGGVLLLTVPWISPWPKRETGEDRWRISEAALGRLLEEEFGPGCAEVHSHGNVRVASAFLYGLARQELSLQELERHDPGFGIVITARAVRRRAG